MTRRQTFALVILLFLAHLSVGQSIAVEVEKFPGSKKLINKSYNGCCAQKGFRSIYYFDDNGRTNKSFNYFKRQLRESYEYRYNDKGLLIESIMVSDSKNKSHKDTTKFVYSLDEKGRVISKTKYFGQWTVTETYSDFDSFNNAQIVTHSFNNTSFVEKRRFNSAGQQIFNQIVEDGNITQIEESQYNQYGDKIYSNVPTLMDTTTGKMISLIGGNRHWFLEEYEYTYDKLNRWIEKYVTYDNKKGLLETRIYK